MKHGSYVSVREEIDDVVFAGFEIDFDLGEAGDIGTCLTVMRIFVASRRDEALPGKSRYRLLRKAVHVRIHFMPVVNAAHLNSLLRGLRQSHAGASAFAEDLLVADIILFGAAAEAFGRNLLQPFLGFFGHGVCRAGHSVSSLASARYARPR